MTVEEWIARPPSLRGRITTCAVCLTGVSEYDTHAVHSSAEHPYAVDGDVCAGCACNALTYYRATCPLCGIVGHRLGNFISICGEVICPLCHKQYDADGSEQTRVSKQRTRASNAGLPAALTLVEWLQALIDFGGRCAYCSGPFDDLEHFIPVSQGGGTTAQNCVPACKVCNGSKDHPRYKRLSSDALAFVGAYLDGWTSRNPVTGARAGQTYPILRRYGG